MDLIQTATAQTAGAKGAFPPAAGAGATAAAGKGDDPFADLLSLLLGSTATAGLTAGAVPPAAAGGGTSDGRALPAQSAQAAIDGSRTPGTDPATDPGSLSTADGVATGGTAGPATDGVAPPAATGLPATGADAASLAVDLPQVTSPDNAGTVAGGKGRADKSKAGGDDTTPVVPAMALPAMLVAVSVAAAPVPTAAGGNGAASAVTAAGTGSGGAGSAATARAATTTMLAGQVLDGDDAAAPPPGGASPGGTGASQLSPAVLQAFAAATAQPTVTAGAARTRGATPAQGPSATGAVTAPAAQQPQVAAAPAALDAAAPTLQAVVPGAAQAVGAGRPAGNQRQATPPLANGGVTVRAGDPPAAAPQADPAETATTAAKAQILAANQAGPAAQANAEPASAPVVGAPAQARDGTHSAHDDGDTAAADPTSTGSAAALPPGTGHTTGLAPTGPAGQNAQTAQAQGQQASPIDQVAVQIQHGLADGGNKVTIHLKPEELGRVDVTLHFGHDGQVTAAITADHAHTLSLLQKDSSSLQQSLRDAGYNTQNGGLSFNLRGDGQFQRNQGGQPFTPPAPSYRSTSASSDTSSTIAASLPSRRSYAAGRIDVTV